MRNQFVLMGFVGFVSISVSFIVLTVIANGIDQTSEWEIVYHFREWLIAAIIVSLMKIMRFLVDQSTFHLKSQGLCKKQFLFDSTMLVTDILFLLATQKIFSISEGVFDCLNAIKIVSITGNLLYSISFDENFSSTTKTIFDFLTVSGFLGLSVGEFFYSLSCFMSKHEALVLNTIFLVTVSISISIFSFAIYKLINGICIDLSHWICVDHTIKLNFIRSIAFLVFSVSSVMLQFTLTNSDLAVSLLIFQVILVFYHDVMQDYYLKSKMREKEGQLETRLDMMRYISHEMRTPLNTALLGLETLLDSKNKMVDLSDIVGTLIKNEKSRLEEKPCDSMNPDEKLEFERQHEKVEAAYCLANIQDQVETVKQIRNSCTIAVGTLDDILVIDKLEAGKLQTELKNINPWHFIKTESQPFYLNAREKKISLKLECVDHDSRWYKTNLIQGDAFKLGQVIRNLLSNAIKFTPFNGIVTIKIERVPFTIILESKEQSLSLDQNLSSVEFGIRISIKDSGAGISKENQDKLFGRYIQINPGELQQGKGSGLGLWISKKIIELHGGWIYVTSDGEGAGSTFTIDLPLIISRVSGINNSSINLKSYYRSTKRIKVENRIIENSIGSELSGFSRRSSSHNSLHFFQNLIPNKVAPMKNETDDFQSKNDQSISTPRGSFTKCWESKLSFMIVDDSHMSCKLLKKALESYGHSVITASNGQECIDVMKEIIYLPFDQEDDMRTAENVPKIHGNSQRINSDIESGILRKEQLIIDVILIDDNMPILTGVEATKRLRNLGYMGLIYGVTGDVEANKRQAFLDNGANEVLPKPLNLKKLKFSINSQLLSDFEETTYQT